MLYNKSTICLEQYGLSRTLNIEISIYNFRDVTVYKVQFINGIVLIKLNRMFYFPCTS